ncbi:MAG: transposase [Bryobacteraceae bacterium]
MKVDFQGSRVTFDGGLIGVRELDERLGLGDLIVQHLTDSRRGKNAQLPPADLLRQSVYSRMAGYEDVNDAERPSQDPTFRLIGSEKIWDRGAALTSRLQTFEAEMLAEEENSAGLARISRELIGKAEAVDSPQRVVLDRDSTEIPVYGEQEQSAYNGHFEPTCYPPCCCSTARATVWPPSSGPATCTEPMAGKTCCCRRAQRAPSGSRSKARMWCFAPDPEGTAAFAKP